MSPSLSRAWLVAATTLGWLLLSAPVASAHKVTLFAWVADGQVHTESKFSGGKRVKGGKIEVYDHQENKVLEGVSDDQGYFAFPVPKVAHTLKIVLVAGMGHGNQWVVSAQEIEEAETAPSAIEPSPAPVKTAQVEASLTADDPVHTMDVAVVEKIVEDALDRKLAPIKAQIAEQSWGMRDIVGGLGYILGLMGLASFVRYRKQQRPDPES